MKGNLSSKSGMQGNSSYGGFDLHGPIRVHHHQHKATSPHLRQASSSMTIHGNFPLTIGATQDEPTFSLADYNKPDRAKSASDDDELILTEDNAENRSDLSKGKKASPWQRVKWTDSMVRLLITAVSYITEEAGAECGSGSKRKYTNLQKKGKWKSVSKAMAERGHFVSPQQCEDKFNDLNKRYKRLNEILGRGTSCEVVEKPALLDVMDHVSEKAKEEVRKILSSKHLHYEEMCSYHNGNRLHLPPDLELQRSLRLALGSRDDHDHDHVDGRRHLNEDNNDDNDDDDDDRDSEFDDHGEYEVSLNCNKKFISQCDANKAPFGGTRANTIPPKQSLNHWSVQVEEQRLSIEMQMLELEKEKFQWRRFCRKKDMELETKRMEIERMKLENERIALDLRLKEYGTDNS